MTNRGNPLLPNKEHRYNCKRRLGGRIYWVNNKASQRCNVSIVTYDDVIIRIKNDHNHLTFRFRLLKYKFFFSAYLMFNAILPN